MVKFWDDQFKKGIILTKILIKHCEAHGLGDTAMKEKGNLKKQEHQFQLWKDKTK